MKLLDASPRFALVSALLLSFLLGGCAVAPPSPSTAAVSQLAPGGKVRVALFQGNPVVVNQPAGETLTGLGVDIGQALATRLGVAFEPVRYATATALLADTGTGKWDVALLGVEPARMGVMDFTAPYGTIENTYLVPAGSGLMTIADADRKGVRIGVADRTVQHSSLTAQIKQARLVLVAGGPAGLKALADGQVEAFAGNRSALENLAAQMPGYRLLPGGFMHTQFALGVPKGRPAGAAFADEFIRHLVASGAVDESIARSKVKNFKSSK